MSVIDLVLNAVPAWVWGIALAIILALTIQWWLPIWLSLPRWLKGLIIGLGALFAAYLLGRNKGFRDEQARRDKANANAIKNRNEVNDAIGKMDAPAVDKRLDRWLRD